FLLVYNFIAMSSLSASIASMESSIKSEQAYIEDLKTQLNAISSESAIRERVEDAGYSKDTPISDDILIVDVPKIDIKESVPQTNWFNDFCEFISSIFGG
ncbi:MAG: hypothetical protein ACI4TX_01920, partial [Christensenellales bacterium]